MKIDKADTVFSRYIRTRDNWTCQRCKKQYPENSRGLQCSHYFGRRKENTRFDPNNCDALCHGCHRIWEKEDREDYRDFKIKQLGEKEFNNMRLRSNMIKKKDRKLDYLVWKKELEKIKEEKWQTIS